MNREDHLCWFHGKVSRERAEQILHDEGQEDGVFLVRESNTSAGDFVLSVLHKEQVWHYQIRRHGEDAFFSIDDETKIHGLDSLIEYYQQSSNGLVTQLTAMVKRDPPPNDSRSHGKTNLLHRATKENNQTVVSELLKCGYRNFDAKNQDGQTAVHLACIYSTEEILKLLIKAGANVNSRDTAGNTPLHYASRSKSASFIRTLVNAKANIQNRNIDTGFVPIHDAAKYGNLEAVQELLLCGAPHMPRTISGEFPIDFAREGGHFQVVNYLQQYKPPPANTYSSQWYHGTLDRTEAIKLINEFEINLKQRLLDENLNNMNNKDFSSVQSNANQNTEQNSEKEVDTSGIFLVRYSNRTGYVLTLLCEGQAKNFIILNAMNYLYIDEGPYMVSLEHLIQHYKMFSDGLPVNLRYAVPPKPKPPLPLFSTMPKSVSKKYDQKNNSRTSCSTNNNANKLQNSLPRTTKRNFSHPGDDAMNQIGLFETEDKEEYLDKKKREMHIFRSLKPRSPRKNIFIDGMKSLRKAKIKSSPIIKNDNNEGKVSEKHVEKIDNNVHLAESLIKNLSFSSDFLNRNIDHGLYNIPQNNCAVIDIDIGESSNNNYSSDNDEKLKKSEDKSIAIDDSNSIEETKEQISEFKSNENNYFTKSDKDIDFERNLTDATYFVDAPISALNARTESSPSHCDSPKPIPATLLVTSTGYVPTVDVRIFLENNPDENTSKVINESSAELREFSKHPERLDSVISRLSTDSELMGIFNLSSSPSSDTSSAENSKAKLNYFIPNECLSLNDIIGEGEFGSVYNGTLKCLVGENGTSVHYDVAIKTLRDDHCRSNKQEFLREASVMIQLKHHCIVKLIGISKGKTLMMVQELVPLGSMLSYILNNSDKINPNYELKIWASQIACGMNYLESQHFVHRDLAARNILLASKHQIKISDFGLSRALNSGNQCYQASQGGKWPIKWYAPESFNHGYFSHASDVWSFGITLWEMYSLGQPPYGDMRGVDAIKLIENGHRLPKPDLCPDNVYKIMENCWNYKPKDRPTFKYLTEFFTKNPEYQNLSELIKSEHIS